MKPAEHLITVAISVTCTLAVVRGLESDRAILPQANAHPRQDELVVDRLVVRKELVVSDTGAPWEPGFESQQIARGVVLRSLAPDDEGHAGVAGIWVRGRLIKTELDDPFDDRFHAMNRDGSMFRAPGHLSWNVWVDGAWRQMAIIQGEGVEPTEVPAVEWTGGNHPGRLRFQTFRPAHQEPLTDALIGQGMMSVGGGGYGGGGLPSATAVLDLWGGNVRIHPLHAPDPPRIVATEGSAETTYALIAVGPQGAHSAVSDAVRSEGAATLEWDSVPGADAYIIVRNGTPVTGLLRIEGSVKRWSDRDE